ncbi:hypothetical protein EMPG_10664, partial [Blastomyces silverae]
NNYLVFQRHYRYLTVRHNKLDVTVNNIHHDIFLINLKEHQKFFVKTCLDNFYITDQNSIENIDIDNLIKQLMN